MTMVSKEIGRTGITIDVRGNLLKDGRRRIEPDICPETGYPVFQLPDHESITRLRKEYVHVQVFCVHSGVPIRRRLGPEDVEPINGNRLRTELTNLRLTKKGMEKVYGDPANKATSGKKPPGGTSPGTTDGKPPENTDVGKPGKPETTEPGESGEQTEEGQNSPEEVATSDTGTKTGQADDESDQSAKQTEPPVDEQSDQKSADPPAEQPDDKAQPVVTARKTNAKSNYFDILDESGESVLPIWNNGKKVNGDSNVVKLAESNGCKVNFVD